MSTEEPDERLVARRMEGLSVPPEDQECQIDRCPDLAVGLFEWATPRTTLYLCRRHAEVLGAIERPGEPGASDILLREIPGRAMSNDTSR